MPDTMKEYFSGKIFVKVFYQINNTFTLFGQGSFKGDGYCQATR